MIECTWCCLTTLLKTPRKRAWEGRAVDILTCGQLSHVNSASILDLVAFYFLCSNFVSFTQKDLAFLNLFRAFPTLSTDVAVPRLQTPRSSWVRQHAEGHPVASAANWQVSGIADALHGPLKIQEDTEELLCTSKGSTSVFGSAHRSISCWCNR